MKLYFEQTLLLLFLLSNAEAFHHRQGRPLARRTCGTASPSTNLTISHHWLHHHERKANELWNSTTMQHHIERHHYLGKRDPTISDFHDPYHLDPRQVNSALFTIGTYVHVVADSTSATSTSSHYVTDAQINAQIAYLNNAYAAAGIAYTLLGITRTVNDTWARNGDDLAMKRALRQGTYASLNIYYQTQLQDNNPSAAPSPNAFLLGFCTLPSVGVTSKTPRSAYVTDGCNVLSGTLPGSWQKGYNQGGTTTHEVGHWNGLLHTFQGYTCDPEDWGDYVADTPQQAKFTTGCPLTQDSCPESGVPAGSYDGIGPNPYGPQGYFGLDAVHNFMDYSLDACYTGFTPGQGARMVNLWVIYRQGR